MRIYITGIAGMLGYNIYNVLKDRAEISGVDLVDPGVSDMAYHRLSLFDTETLERDIADIGPDILIHTAALVNVDECEEDPAYAGKLNIDVTDSLAKLCDKYGIKMIYISTDAVFDGKDCSLYTEEDAVNPINVYGKTKLEGERIVLRYPKNLVIRTNIYGINIRDKQSFGEWICHSLTAGQTLRMFTDIDFSPILVNELAELIYEMCRKDLCGLYHACGTGCITKYEFGRKLKEIFGLETGSIVPVKCETAHLKAARSRHMGMSNRKLSEALQVHISTPEESLKTFYTLMEGKY